VCCTTCTVNPHRLLYLIGIHLTTADFSQAESQFERILSLDPYRIDDIDVLSNILYVTDNRLKLSKLAHDFLALDKDRPEVCCLVGSSRWSEKYNSTLTPQQEITILSAQSMKRRSNTSEEQPS
jgi:hypothetical protein